jgi:hypothetical protein
MNVSRPTLVNYYYEMWHAHLAREPRAPRRATLQTEPVPKPGFASKLSSFTQVDVCRADF